jgi:hypothetical protein
MIIPSVLATIFTLIIIHVAKYTERGHRLFTYGLTYLQNICVTILFPRLQTVQFLKKKKKTLLLVTLLQKYYNPPMTITILC